MSDDRRHLGLKANQSSKMVCSYLLVKDLADDVWITPG